MNYFLPRNCFHDEKNYLSDKINTKQWRNIRAVLVKEVVHYLDDGVMMYQCSTCGEFHKSFDMHDNWTFTPHLRVLYSFSNLCFKCHALEHLEKVYQLNGELHLGQYRGVDIPELVKVLETHYQDVIGITDYNKDVGKCLVEVNERINSGTIYTNDYGLINAYNSFYFKKNPIILS